MNLAELVGGDAEKLHLPPREILFSEGEAGNAMYILVEGSADILVHGQTVASAGPGAVLGELALIEPDEPRPASVRAVTDCELLRIDSSSFERLVARTPRLAVELLRELAGRLRCRLPRLT